MKLPGNNEVVECPHCEARCAFTRKGTIEWPLSNAIKQDMHVIVACYCQSCGGPILQWTVAPRVGGHADMSAACSRVVFPLASTRQKTSAVVRQLDCDLAQDYDEAVSCEPLSLQAASCLLRRCASHILIDNCGAPKNQTLGQQIKHARNDGKLPEHISEQVDGVLNHGNQSAHPWFDDSGEILKVEQRDLDWCFEIVQLMFDHYYIEPQKRAERKQRMEAIVKEKRKGDAASAVPVASCP